MVDLTMLQRISREVRGDVLDMSFRARTPHIGSSLSCVEILVAAYCTDPGLAPGEWESPDRDRFILSKGHAAAALYATLARCGYFPLEWLNRFAENGGPLAEHPIRGLLPGIEVTSGSLGHGLALGIGMALAGRIQRREYRAIVLLSDGECNEGTVWEAALFAPAHKLREIMVIVDYNKWQATGRSNEVLALSPLAAKWAAFGWAVSEIDGHDLNALVEKLAEPLDGAGRPRALIAHTVKGKGVSFMEDDNNWHYRIPSADELQRAKQELGLA